MVPMSPVLGWFLNDHSRDQGLAPAATGSDLFAWLGRIGIRVPYSAPLTPLGLGVILAAAVLLIVWSITSNAPPYVVRPVLRGPLTVTARAAGALAPRNEVDVGAEISGRIDFISVDFNDHVRKGQVLARINTDQLQAQLAQARATLDQSEATLEQNDDTIRRDRALAKSGAVSPQQLVDAEGDLSRARAGVALASAQVKQDETMLSKATIYAPIGGVVLDRRVSVGQTVTATMQTPVLFTLASDLSEMELKVGIGEADVGKIQPGSAANFTVNAYPARQFSAKLMSIHDAPQILHGIVTYPGVLLVDNRDGLLKPGMTASASIEVAHLRDALLIPNAALLYRPPESAQRSGPKPPAPENGVIRGRVWSFIGGKLVSRDVILGPSDGNETAVMGGALRVGDAVVVDAKRL